MGVAVQAPESPPKSSTATPQRGWDGTWPAILLHTLLRQMGIARLWIILRTRDARANVSRLIGPGLLRKYISVPRLLQGQVRTRTSHFVLRFSLIQARTLQLAPPHDWLGGTSNSVPVLVHRMDGWGGLEVLLVRARRWEGLWCLLKPFHSGLLPVHEGR